MVISNYVKGNRSTVYNGLDSVIKPAIFTGHQTPHFVSVYICVWFLLTLLQLVEEHRDDYHSVGG